MCALPLRGTCRPRISLPWWWPAIEARSLPAGLPPADCASSAANGVAASCKFPDAEGLRPTPDRVRETLFNWLGQDLTGMRCLDLFAGSGALGLEAASRGAEKVVLVEQNPRVAEALLSNIRLLQAADRVELVRQDALNLRHFDGTDVRSDLSRPALSAGLDWQASSCRCRDS